MGDYVRLGPTAVEKHYVLRVGGDGTVQLRQASTGQVRNVRADRCVVVRAASEGSAARAGVDCGSASLAADYADTHWCEKCGDFLSWCPDARADEIAR